MSALGLISNTSAIGIGITTKVSGTGGTTPYVYSVLAGGAGGTINSSTGLYTAPTTLGSDYIQVVDAAANTAVLKMEVASPILLLCDVIRTCLNLAEDQVYLYNQKILVPKDSRLYVAVRMLMLKNFGNTRSLDATSGLSEVQSANMAATVSLDIQSRSLEALTRKEEVLMALKSIYSQSQQELNSFFIATVPTEFVDLSEVDGPAIPYRFNISVRLQYTVTKTTAIPYFDNFQVPAVTTDP